jgi:hypothetical protein
MDVRCTETVNLSKPERRLPAIFLRGRQGLRPEHVHVRKMAPLSPIFEGRCRRGAHERTVLGFTSYILHIRIWIIRWSIGQAPTAIVRLGGPAAIS